MILALHAAVPVDKTSCYPPTFCLPDSVNFIFSPNFSNHKLWIRIWPAVAICLASPRYNPWWLIGHRMSSVYLSTVSVYYYHPFHAYRPVQTYEEFEQRSNLEHAIFSQFCCVLIDWLNSRWCTYCSEWLYKNEEGMPVTFFGAVAGVLQGGT